MPTHSQKHRTISSRHRKSIPELVTETNDIKSVNYQGLVPVLINAMKEQQDEIDSGVFIKLSSVFYQKQLTNSKLWLAINIQQFKIIYDKFLT